MRLTPMQVAFFKENGFLAVPDVVPAARVAAMRTRIEELCERWESEEARRLGVQQEAEAGAPIAERSSRTVRKLSFLARHELIFGEHARDPVLLDIVEDLIGSPLALYADEAFLKPPFHGSEKLPHQDNAYFGVQPDAALITCWTALDDATVENGCMHYLAGSHKLGVLDHEPIPGTPHRTPKGVDLGEAVAVPIQAGGVILHHALVLHFSPGNQTPNWRRAYTCHYVRSDAQDLGTRDPMAPPVLELRGRRAG